jgi:filamentous hemagglutinin family protein
MPRHFIIHSLPLPIFLGVLSLFNLYAHAEVVLDGTLGPPGALQGPTFDIRANLGQQRGDNLFHSFQSFNLNAGEIASFSGPDTTRNVISRVTGGSPSTIDGTLRSTLPQANLYFLNPKGILFGEHAQLDVPGSMHFSTADELRFSDGSQFVVSQPRPLLTIAPPSAFGFLSNTPAKITSTGGQLSVSEGNSLSLIGGDINLQTGTSLTAPAGRLNLVSVASPGQVTPTATGLDMNGFTQRGHLTANQVKLEVSSGNGKGAGAIYIRGSAIEVNDSQIYGNPQDKDGGVIDIAANELTLSKTDISTSTLGAGKSGNILVNADGTVNISGQENGLFANSKGAGEGGKISITAKELHLTEGGQIGNGTFGAGNGRDIEIKVSGAVTLSKEALIQNNSEGTGNAGAIFIKAAKLTLSDGSQLTSSTFGAGQGGAIVIEVADTISLEGYMVADNIYPSGITTSTLDRGDAGTIRLTTKQLKINQGATIESATSWGEDIDGVTYYATGKSGTVTLNVTGALEIAGVEKVAGTDQTVVSKVNSRSDGTGNAGQIVVHTPLLILTNGGQITTSVERELAEAGTIELYMAQLQVNNQASITSESRGAGNAGNIHISASDCVTIKDAKVSTEAKEAAGGNITITVPRLLEVTKGAVTTSVKGGEGGGGNVTLAAPVFVVLDKAKVIAQAVGGNGGNIMIKSNQFVASQRPSASIIDASSQKGINGTVVITAPNRDVGGKLLFLTGRFHAIHQLPSSCQSRLAEQSGSFTVTEREGVGNAGDDFLPSGPLLSKLANNSSPRPVKQTTKATSKDQREAMVVCGKTN